MKIAVVGAGAAGGAVVEASGTESLSVEMHMLASPAQGRLPLACRSAIGSAPWSVRANEDCLIERCVKLLRRHIHTWCLFRYSSLIRHWVYSERPRKKTHWMTNS